MDVSFFGDLLQTIADRGRALVNRSWGGAAPTSADLIPLCEALLSERGEASGVALAREILVRFEVLPADERVAFLGKLSEQFGPDKGRLDEAIAAYLTHPDGRAMADLRAAAAPQRLELIRRLNLAPGNTAGLVRMREEALRHHRAIPGFEAMDADFAYLFSNWFNRGFLVMRRIDWTTPANILQKIIRYEAVHEIRDWEDLRRRIEPPDRRCFAFFHPQLVDEPLIFVEVALTTGIPGAIGAVLSETRAPLPAERATTAVFYSISNCQDGLRGISFGNFLIKQVVEELSREIPSLRTFVTLSPVPGFAAWLKRERQADAAGSLGAEERRALAALDADGWHADGAAVDGVKPALLKAASRYFLSAKAAGGKPVDPVARFHLGNGARLERINAMGDLSAKGLAQAHGLMVNYLYDLNDIERNHEAYATRGTVACAASVRRLLKGDVRASAD